MSMYYGLELEALAEPESILQLLSEHLTFEWQDYKSPQPPYKCRRLAGGHTQIYASTLTKPPEWMKRRFGFDAHLSLTMDISMPSPEALCEAMRTVMHCTILLLENLPGDAVLSFYDEVLVLYRQKGRLILNSTALLGDTCYEEIIREIKLPYEMQELPYRI